VSQAHRDHCAARLLSPIGFVQEQNRGNLRIELIDEDSLAEGLKRDYVSALLVARGANPERSGWYFQQFLKLCYSLDPSASDYYLVWDADTIP